MPNDAERQSMQGAHFDEALTIITATKNEIFIKRQHRQPFRFANTITPLAHEARRDPDTAQRQEIVFIVVPNCWCC